MIAASHIDTRSAYSSLPSDGQTVVGKARNDRGTEIARKRLRRRPANPIRDSELDSQRKSGCTGAIFSFMPQQVETLANRGRPCTVNQPRHLQSALYSDAALAFEQSGRCKRDVPEQQSIEVLDGLGCRVWTHGMG